MDVLLALGAGKELQTIVRAWLARERPLGLRPGPAWHHRCERRIVLDAVGVGRVIDVAASSDPRSEVREDRVLRDEVAHGGDIIDVGKLHPRDRVERDGVLLDHDVPERLHARGIPKRQRAGDVGADQVPLDHAIDDVDPDAPVPGDQIARAGLGTSHDQLAHAVQARPARDAAAPVREGHRAGAVGADQVPLDEVGDAERE